MRYGRFLRTENRGWKSGQTLPSARFVTVTNGELTRTCRTGETRVCFPERRLVD